MRFKIYSLLLLLLLLSIIISFFLFIKKPEPLPVEAPRSSESLMRADELGETLVRGIKEENIPLLKKLTSPDLKKEKSTEVNLENEWRKCGAFLNEFKGSWEVERFKDYGGLVIMEISVKSRRGKRRAIFVLKEEDLRWRVRDFWCFQDDKNGLN
jgi:hypothetical protein